MSSSSRSGSKSNLGTPSSLSIRKSTSSLGSGSTTGSTIRLAQSPPAVSGDGSERSEVNHHSFSSKNTPKGIEESVTAEMVDLESTAPSEGQDATPGFSEARTEVSESAQEVSQSGFEVAFQAEEGPGVFTEHLELTLAVLNQTNEQVEIDILADRYDSAVVDDEIRSTLPTGWDTPRLGEGRGFSPIEATSSTNKDEEPYFEGEVRGTSHSDFVEQLGLDLIVQDETEEHGIKGEENQTTLSELLQLRPTTVQISASTPQAPSLDAELRKMAKSIHSLVASNDELAKSIASIAVKKSTPELSRSAGSKMALAQIDTMTLEPEVNRNELIQAIKSALDLQVKISKKNTLLQHKISEILKKKKGEESKESDKQTASDQELRYLSCVKEITNMKSDFHHVQEETEKSIQEQQNKRSEILNLVDSRCADFMKHKRTVASLAVYSKLGKPMPSKVIDQLEAVELRKNNELTHVRLENIKLKTRIRRDEHLLRQKEELAEGLHLIDFEQLKIENQTCNEKIEERNEELLKLRKKITTVVQVLTHVKEKLQFCITENKDRREELSSVEEQVRLARDSLPQLKLRRDAVRMSNTNLKDNYGLMGQKALLRDFENRKDHGEQLKSSINALRERHAEISGQVLSMKRKLQRHAGATM